MNWSAFAALLQTLLSLIPMITSSAKINEIIAQLINIIPVAVQEAQDVVPLIRNIIAALSNSSSVTPDQVAALKALDAQIDASYDAALAAYMAARTPQPAAQ
ncbi:hypothetical protein MesoLj131c_61770 [Mesorhizobium sp. 131-3-5]|uniref:hypothetical protein n=1 Tax=Mesorhizobium sp. 131-3-5 TaxID=2744520 RepID=UPI001928627A|nr:hypothetical protein [Mesorhizobium sp. 131-3-5]BCH11919.1 hypothetical protein MesoLj131c_61770 [Mesorhizobium sp. 131-3-5]